MTKTLYALLICFALSLSACSSSSSDDPADTGTENENENETDNETDNGTENGGTENGSTDSSTDGSTSENADTGGGSTGATSGSISSFGTISFERASSEFSDSGITASFFALDQNLPLVDIEAAFTPTADTCQVSTTDFGDFTIPTLDGAPVDVTSLSAGEVLTVSSPAGTYVELQRDEGFGFIFYDVDTDLPTPIPTELTVDIPGDEFPAFSNVAIPNVAPLTGVSPGFGQTLTADTVFTWDAGNNENARIDITLVDTSALLDPSQELVSVSCLAIDDGSFQIPAQTAAQLPAGFSAGNSGLTRTAFSVLQNDNSLLIVTAITSSGF